MLHISFVFNSCISSFFSHLLFFEKYLIFLNMLRVSSLFFCFFLFPLFCFSFSIFLSLFCIFHFDHFLCSIFHFKKTFCVVFRYFSVICSSIFAFICFRIFLFNLFIFCQLKKTFSFLNFFTLISLCFPFSYL